jgi:hypothetical protein
MNARATDCDSGGKGSPPDVSTTFLVSPEARMLAHDA